MTHSKMKSPMFHVRHANPKKSKSKRRLSKRQIEIVRHFVSLSILGCAIVTLFLSWGAMEIEEYANRIYPLEPKFNTECTCFFTSYDETDIKCSHIIKNSFHRFLAYYGLRADCALSTPLIAISLISYWQASYTKTILLSAHIFGWTKSISIAAALTCVLIDDPSFMREIFEKSQFGTYESKMLYSFTMVAVSLFADICMLIVLSFAPCVPDKVDSKYIVSPNHMKQDSNIRVLPGNSQLITKKKNNTTSVSAVETISNDTAFEDTFAHLASPV